jgi:uncharacterized membrane protein
MHERWIEFSSVEVFSTYNTLSASICLFSGIQVAETLKVSGTAVSAAIAADNVVVALYFTFLFALAKPGEPQSAAVVVDQPRNDTDLIHAKTGVVEAITTEEQQETTKGNVVVDPESVDNDASSFSLPALALSLCVSSALVTTCGIL